MIVLADAGIVLPDRVLAPGTLVIHDGRILEVRSGTLPSYPGALRRELTNHYIVPGFVDVHVHGVEGHDTLDGGDSLREMATRLPRYGVTAFCPTTVACGPTDLRALLDRVRTLRSEALEDRPRARVLPAHLESNFINPEYRGAQPLACLRLPPRIDETTATVSAAGDRAADDYDGADILAEIDRGRPDVGIITLAPELAGALPLIGALTGAGHRVSLGHSGASYEEGLAGIAAGARHATHVFNRMSPLGHRAPGLVGAVLTSDEVAIELIADGYHVHPAAVRLAVAAKGAARTMAITDGTAGSGLPRGAHARLGGRRITVGEAAHLDDGTLAGSVLTMDRAFRVLAGLVGLSLVDAAMLCATTPARELGLHGHGAIAAGAIADLVVLDAHLNVVETFVAGRSAFRRMST